MGIEDDALQVALRPPDTQAMTKGRGHRPQRTGGLPPCATATPARRMGSFLDMRRLLAAKAFAQLRPLGAKVHAGALLLWTVLFPDYPEVGAFSLVMHTFFVVFNAIIGVLFLPKANRELFGDVVSSPAR